MCAGDPGGDLMWMYDHLFPQKMMVSWTAQENDCKSNTKSTDQLKTNNQPKALYQTSDQGQATHPRSGYIATKRVTHLRAVRLQPTEQMIDQTIGQTRAQVQAPALRSELIRGPDQGLEFSNWPGAKSWL